MYELGRTPEQYFEEILSLAMKYGKQAFDLSFCDNHQNHSISRILLKQFPTAVHQIVFEVYYVLYLLLEEKHSIYYHYKKRIDKNLNEVFNEHRPDYVEKLDSLLGKYKYVNFKDETSHNKIQRNYKTFRKNSDNLAKCYYNIENVGLYTEIKDKYTGHKLRKLDYIFLERILDNKDIEFFFDSLREDRLLDNKKISNTKFYEVIIPSIEKMYELIEQTKYNDSNSMYSENFLRSIDYYQFEKNCSIELYYMSAYALSQVKKTLEEKQRDREIFHDLRWSQLEFDRRTHYIQNKSMFCNKIFCEYIDENIDANEVAEIYASFNSCVYIALYKCLKSFFGESFGHPISIGYWLNILQDDEELKQELNLTSLDKFMCNDTELFFNTYLGKGQHISKKMWNVIKVKDFRELYKSL